MNRESEFQKRVREGAKEGLGYGVTFLAVAAVLTIARGRDLSQTYGLRVTGLVVFYLGGGILTGALVAALAPFARGAVSAAIVGFIGMFPICFVGTLLLLQPGEWEQMIPAVPLIVSALYGILGSVMFRNVKGLW